MYSGGEYCFHLQGQRVCQATSKKQAITHKMIVLLQSANCLEFYWHNLPSNTSFHAWILEQGMQEAKLINYDSKLSQLHTMESLRVISCAKVESVCYVTASSCHFLSSLHWASTEDTLAARSETTDTNYTFIAELTDSWEHTAIYGFMGLFHIISASFSICTRSRYKQGLSYEIRPDAILLSHTFYLNDMLGTTQPNDSHLVHHTPWNETKGNVSKHKIHQLSRKLVWP